MSDLKGGHSGDNINDRLANSNKLVARLLWEGIQKYELRLSYFCGGNLRNAIPREAYAIFGVPTKMSKEFERMFAGYAHDVKEEYHTTEPNLKITLNHSGTDMVIDAQTQFGLVYSLVGVPNGVVSMSQDILGFVETSSNLASVKFDGDSRVVVTSSQRSSLESAKYYAMSAVDSVFSLDRKSVVEGKSVRPGVGLGGRCCL